MTTLYIEHVQRAKAQGFKPLSKDAFFKVAVNATQSR